MAWLLDTNLLSEIRKVDRCAHRIRDWYDRENQENLFVRVVVLGEIRWGIENVLGRDLPQAKALENWLGGRETAFASRIVPVTMGVCDIRGRFSIGNLLPCVDRFLAATARYHRLTFVTRNKRDVARSGVDCFDPFVD